MIIELLLILEIFQKVTYEIAIDNLNLLFIYNNVCNFINYILIYKLVNTKFNKKINNFL